MNQLTLEDSQSVTIRRNEVRFCEKCRKNILVGPVDVSWPKIDPPESKHVDEIVEAEFNREFASHTCASS